jgi:hypothetical protein
VVRVRRVTVKEGMDGSRGCEGFDGFVTKTCRDGLPSASGVAFYEGEEL